MVFPTGIEPVSKPSEGFILSIELREHSFAYFPKIDTINPEKAPVLYEKYSKMQIIFDKAARFLGAPSILPKLIVVYGPTACGKTALSVEIAKRFDAEIIGADSRQIYRYMDIGTGKVTHEEMQAVPHHMIDIRNPDEEYSVGAYQKEAFAIIGDIRSRKKIPILCGGTGLYLDSVAFHFDMPALEADWGYREQLDRIRIEK